VSEPGAVKHATRWSAFEIGIRYVLQFGVTVVLAHLIDPGAYGIVAMVLVFTALGNVFVDSGTGLALIQRQCTNDDEETSAFVINLAISLLACTALVAGAPSIAEFYGRPEVARLCVVLAVVFPLNALAVVPDALLTQQLRFHARARVELGSSLISGAIAISLATMGFGPWALVFQAIASIGSRAAMLYLISGWYPKGRYRNEAARSIAGFGGYMLVAGLIDTAYNRLQAVLIGRLFSARDLGFYSLAQNTQQAPTSFAAALLNRLGLPLLSSVNGDIAEVRKLLRTALRMSLFAFAPMMVILAIYASPVVRLVYGERWLPAGPLLAILTLGAIPWPAHVLSLVVLNALGHPRLVLRVEVVKKAIAVTLLITSAPWGLPAMAWSTVITSLVSYVLNAYVVGRRIGYDALTQLHDLLPTALATLGASVIAWGCVVWLPSSLWTLCAGAALAGATHLAIGWALGHPAIDGFLQLVLPRSR
jgi:O-antigen/teichoic acid export membrane protein